MVLSSVPVESEKGSCLVVEVSFTIYVSFFIDQGDSTTVLRLKMMQISLASVNYLTGSLFCVINVFSDLWYCFTATRKQCNLLAIYTGDTSL